MKLPRIGPRLPVLLAASFADALSTQRSASAQSRALRHAADLLDSLRYDLAHSAKPLSSASLEGLQLLQRDTETSDALDHPPAHRESKNTGHESKRHSRRQAGPRQEEHGLASPIFTTKKELSSHSPATVQILAAKMREAALDSTLEDQRAPNAIVGMALQAHVDRTAKKLHSASSIADLPASFWNTYAKHVLEGYNAQKKKKDPAADLMSFLNGAFQRASEARHGAMPDPLDLPAWIAFGQQFKIMDAFQKNMQQEQGQGASPSSLLSAGTAVSPSAGDEEGAEGEQGEGNGNEKESAAVKAAKLPKAQINERVHHVHQARPSRTPAPKRPVQSFVAADHATVEEEESGEEDVPAATDGPAQKLTPRSAAREDTTQSLVTLEGGRSTSAHAASAANRRMPMHGPMMGSHTMCVVIVVLLVVLCISIYLCLRRWSPKPRDGGKLKAVPYPPAKLAARMATQDVADDVVQFAPSRRVAMAAGRKLPAAGPA